MPGVRRSHPRGDPLMNLAVGPVADDHLSTETQARVDEARLAVAVRRLIEVHEIHVDGSPRQVAVELGVKMEEGLFQQRQPAYPHLRGRKRVHPHHESRAVGCRIGVDADLRDFVRRRKQGLELER